MEAIIRYQNHAYRVRFSRPLDLSIPVRSGLENPNCFYAPPPAFEPVVTEAFTGSTQQGGVVNFFNVKINPHGNGTHTECVGHIAKAPFFIRQCLNKYHFLCKLVSLFPRKTPTGDRVIFRDQLEEILGEDATPALTIRTLPNDDHKLRTNYSGANPPYLHPDAVSYLVQCGVQHLLVDLPSVDREEDGGKLLAHKAFWNYYPGADIREDCTISEMIYAAPDIRDGLYLLNLQIISLELDVSPSKPVLYALELIE
ncbi:MAG: cyclase family protein [Bacteroidetes bacterium]|nr:MAG: cyclase family protein [Bacteroidota bacterium]